MKVKSLAVLGLLGILFGTTCAPAPSPTAEPPTRAPTAPAPAPTLTPTTISHTPMTVARCEPTRPNAEGPFYKPNALVRNRVGQGHVLTGVVRSAASCATIANARIEFWMANPTGEYDDDRRATLFSDRDGAYRFESHFPPAYGSRPPHIHVRVSADGFQVLTTQYYPPARTTAGTFDLVLTPR